MTAELQGLCTQCVCMRARVFVQVEIVLSTDKVAADASQSTYSCVGEGCSPQVYSSHLPSLHPRLLLLVPVPLPFSYNFRRPAGAAAAP